MKGQLSPCLPSAGLKGHLGSTGRSQHLPTPVLALGAPGKSGDQKDDNRSSSFLLSMPSNRKARAQPLRAGAACGGRKEVSLWAFLGSLGLKIELIRQSDRRKAYTFIS